MRRSEYLQPRWLLLRLFGIWSTVVYNFAPNPSQKWMRNCYFTDSSPHSRYGQEWYAVDANAGYDLNNLGKTDDKMLEILEFEQTRAVGA